MQKSKILWIIVIFIVTISINFNISFADDEIEENITGEEIKEIIETTASVEDNPIINSRKAIVFDRISKQILYGKQENRRCKMASTTKIMTAIIVVENKENLKEKIKISSKAAGVGGSRLGLHTNDEISWQDLLYGLLLCSRK